MKPFRQAVSGSFRYLIDSRRQTFADKIDEAGVDRREWIEFYDIACDFRKNRKPRWVEPAQVIAIARKLGAGFMRKGHRVLEFIGPQ